MYELRIERDFTAGHALKLYDGTMEPMHEHVWRVLVHVQAAELDAMEVVMDFHALETIVGDVLRPLDGTRLNDVEAFAAVNPSAERVAEHIYKAIAPRLPEYVNLTCVTVTEAPGCRASFWR
jgi:6-pyruvoyltetrahydropterin/6-carboxytetrahydropterin synthase